MSIEQFSHHTFTSPDGANKEFQLIPGRLYFFTVATQAAQLQFETAPDVWKNFTESDGSNSQGFWGASPYTGKVQAVSVTTGAIISMTQAS